MIRMIRMIGMIHWLHETVGAEAGGKAVNLARMIQAGLPVPGGFALEAQALGGLPDVAPQWSHTLQDALEALEAEHVAVRSSGLGEDTAGASFAGIHASLLGVPAHAAAVTTALEEVAASARSAGARAYRVRRGLPDDGRIGAVVQTMVVPRVSGVAFGRDPITGRRCTVIEASWGLGEAVVSGLVTPDHFELEPDGTPSVRRIADKDLAIVATGGETAEVEVEPELREIPCLSDADLAALRELCLACERLFGRPQDVEFALTDAGPVLLQSRPITR